MSTDLLKALTRLKRRFGRERGRLDRWEARERSSPTGNGLHAERYRIEATQWRRAMGMIDAEIRKAKP